MQQPNAAIPAAGSPLPAATAETAEVRRCLSPARMTTYDAAVTARGTDASTAAVRALELYRWNAEISAAFLAPLHMCEVIIRNGISEAIEGTYGARWPWSPSFHQSLPAPSVGYNPQRDLSMARRSAPTTGKVIPELKFVFWQKMFTSRHDLRVWDPHLDQAFPQLDTRLSVARRRAEMYADLEQLRLLRNRIAHHEPIFTRNLTDDLAKIIELIGFRSSEAASWTMQFQLASGTLTSRP